MGDAPEKKASHGDVDHGFGHVDALLVVAHEPTPAGHPGEGAFRDPTARQHLEARLAVDAADDLDDEVLEFSLVHELGAIIGAIGEEVLDPGPAAADRMQDELGARTVGDVRRRQVDHEETPVGVDCDVALAPGDLLARVITLRVERRAPF